MSVRAGGRRSGGVHGGIVGLHMLKRRLHDLEERHERTGRKHAADYAHKQPEPVSSGILPDTPVCFPPRILAVEKLFSVLDLGHAF